MNRVSIRQFMAMHAADQLDIYDGWRDCFCNDGQLVKRRDRLMRKLAELVGSPEIDIDGMYVVFNNNCPSFGELYDDFRIFEFGADLPKFTIIPKCGHRVTRDAVAARSIGGYAKLAGRKNNFREYLVEGSWQDIVSWFSEGGMR